MTATKTEEAEAPAGRELVARRAVSYSLLPFALAGCGLGSSPWLRAFPASFAAIPIFGAAILSVLLPIVVIAIGIRRLWLTALIDVAGFAFFTMLVALHHPASLGRLYHGLVDGPAQILTYALPLASHRMLLVPPVALCWLSGAVLGECIGRGWRSVLPYATLLVTFGLAYAGSARAIADVADGRRYDTILAGALLLTMLLMRAAQSWLEQSTEATATAADARLPLRGLIVGVLVAVLVAGLASLLAQTSVFRSTPSAPGRTAPVDQTNPISPLAFVAGLRPDDPTSAGRPLFNVTVSRPSPNYVAIAEVDTYDGDSWSLGTRQFRPSGGVISADTDPSARSRGPVVTQRYRIGTGALDGSPWMPFMFRPAAVSDITVGIDNESAMVVPSSPLTGGTEYTVQSRTPTRTFDRIPATSLAVTSASPTDTELGQLNSDLTSVVAAFRTETDTRDASPIAFLQALESDLRTNYALVGSPNAVSSTSPTSRSGTSNSAAQPSGSSGPTSVTTTPDTQTAGGTGLSNILAAILGQNRTATPEQYATLVALVARRIGVPARVVTGFRLPPSDSNGGLAAGTYKVTTAQAWSWAEIPVRGYGWVVMDAAPGRYSSQNAQPSASARPALNFTPTRTPNALIATNGNNGHAVAPPSAIPASSSLSSLAFILIIVAALVVLVFLLVAIRLLRKRRRVRRRRRGDPRQRVIGAWQETLDALVESGMTELATLTSSEVADAVRTSFGHEAADQVSDLGAAANAAIFKPTATVADSDAASAWRTTTRVRTSIRRRLTRRTRIAAALRYHHPERTTPPSGPASWLLDARNRATAATRAGATRRAH